MRVSAAPSAAPVSSESTSPTAWKQRRLKLVIAVVAFWGATVAALWLTTANPVVLSRPQIAAAQFVVTAQRVPGRAGWLRLEHAWTPGIQGPELEVVNLAALGETRFPPGKSFLVPLTHAPRGLEITTLPGQGSHRPPLVYAVTPEAVWQLRQMLSEQRREIALP